jgi:hypothetical protein
VHRIHGSRTLKRSERGSHTLERSCQPPARGSADKTPPGEARRTAFENGCRCSGRQRSEPDKAWITAEDATAQRTPPDESRPLSMDAVRMAPLEARLAP